VQSTVRAGNKTEYSKFCPKVASATFTSCWSGWNHKQGDGERKACKLAKHYHIRL
jgi:hypothetical protein